MAQVGAGSRAGYPPSREGLMYPPLARRPPGSRGPTRPMLRPGGGLASRDGAQGGQLRAASNAAKAEPRSGRTTQPGSWPDALSGTSIRGPGASAESRMAGGRRAVLRGLPRGSPCSRSSGQRMAQQTATGSSAPAAGRDLDRPGPPAGGIGSCASRGQRRMLLGSPSRNGAEAGIVVDSPGAHRGGVAWSP